MNNFVKTKWFIFGAYLLLVLATMLICFVLLNNNKSLKNVIVSFFEVAENRSFDYRQYLKIVHKRPIPNKDIVILAIDDASLEILWEKYGNWPLPRNIYADVINYLEKEKPQAIVFDLMFIKSMKNNKDADKYLADTINKYDNVYTAMNFDNQTSDLRTPVQLPKQIKMTINENSKFHLSENYKFSNCRTILPEILNVNENIGLVNILRNNDGIIRTVPPLLEYQNNYYPYLTFRVAANYLEQTNVKDLTIKNKTLYIGDNKIPLTQNGDVILNWYGPSGKTHTIVPLYKVIKEIESNHKTTIDFKDKIIIVGTTAMSLHDTKSVPIEEGTYPGVEIHATFINNILDNNFIMKTNNLINIAIILCVIATVGIIVMFSTSTIFSFLSTTLFGIGYLFISYYAMEIYNIWIPVILPSLSIIVAFALSFLAKYLMKVKDFEYQYKLATQDGLTELYNHRYFQDALKMQMDIARRYNQSMSLIMIDIDFFKKFNDTYGHQAGDAVLRQVAKLLKSESRITDIVCRYGGEEMTVILPNTTSDEALFLANRICKTSAKTPFNLTPVDKINITVSVGVATFPENAQTPQDLIEWADKGLYYAKEHGRNQVGMY